MSRKGVIKEVRHISDAKYDNHFIGRFINTIMKEGKKYIAQKIVYGVVNEYMRKFHMNDLDAIQRIEDAIAKVKPTMQLKSKRVGGATLSIPVEVRASKGVGLAIRWTQEAALARKEKTAILRFFHEFLDIEAGKSASLTKKDNIHKMAEANKVYSHYV